MALQLVNDVAGDDVRDMISLHGAAAIREALDRFAPAPGADDAAQLLLDAAWTPAEKAAVVAFVNVATPVIMELREHLPSLRALAQVGTQMAKGGPGAILGLLRGGA